MMAVRGLALGAPEPSAAWLVTLALALGLRRRSARE
jgi:hypothetical protein